MKTIFSVMLVLIVLSAVTGFIWRLEGNNRSKLQFNTKDIQDEGLVLVSPASGEYETELSTLLRNKDDSIQTRLESARPFTTFIRNRSKRKVVAYALKWQIVRTDGSSITQFDSYAEPSLLMGGSLSDNDESNFSRRSLIQNDRARLVSWGGAADDILNSSELSSTASSAGSATTRNEPSLLDNLNTELERAASVNVSLDCAVFDDGSCVGPDTLGFFDQLQAQVQAKKDLLQMIHLKHFTGKDSATIWSEVEAIAQSPEGATLSDNAPINHYKFYRRLFANELLTIRRASKVDDKDAILRAIEPLRKKWLPLRKKRNS